MTLDEASTVSPGAYVFAAWPPPIGPGGVYTSDDSATRESVDSPGTAAHYVVQVSGGIRASGKHQRHVIDVAPAPILARLEGSDHGMVSAVKVLGRMAVWRRIAASHVSAGETQPQMDPRVPGLQTLFTAPRARLDVADFIQVRAFGHKGTPLILQFRALGRGQRD